MSAKHADVLLISDDQRLRASVHRHRPEGARLRCLSTDGLTDPQPVTARQVWIDLDCAPAVAPPGGARRVYFYSRPEQAAETPPPGVFIRKPGTAAVFDVLWAGLDADGARNRSRAPAELTLPAWLLEFQELRLKPLCNKLITRLGPRLGYRDASLYLHDRSRQLLTLAETTHARSIDLVVPSDAPSPTLMTAVARRGRLLRTERVSKELPNLGVARCHDASYDDEYCLIVPLACDGELVGVLNFSGHSDAAPAKQDLPLDTIFAFLGRALHFARAHELAQTEARVDCLTGLYNQRGMTEALDKEIPRAERFATPLTVLLIDLDGLKNINDQEGHAAGDCVLRHVAGRIARVLRHFDGAARVGGDEFVVMLPHTDLKGARQVARRLLRALREDCAHFRDVPLAITASIGVAEWRTGWNAQQLVEAADQAMYSAKRRGRGDLACYPQGASPATDTRVPAGSSAPDVPRVRSLGAAALALDPAPTITPPTTRPGSSRETARTAHPPQRSDA